MRRALQRRRGKLAARELRLLERNDELVRQILERERRLSGIVSAEGPTDVDELLWFVADELGLLPVFEDLAPPPTYVHRETGKVVQRRTGYGPPVLNLLGLISRYLGVGSNPEIEAAVLVDERWMGLLGFTATEVEDGACRRGESLRGKTRQGAGGPFVEADSAGPVRTRLDGPRGALSSQTLQAHESALEPWALIETFNAVVRALVVKGYFPKEVRGSLDCTGEEVVPTFSGAGTVRKKVEVRTKARRPRKVEVTIRGFKVWYLMDVETGLPMAMTLDTINTPDTEHVRPLIDQALANLKGHCRLVSVALDRGFLDGDLLWWLKQARGLDWYCPAKEKMSVTAEARQRVFAVLSAQRSANEGPSATARRLARQGEEHDGVRFSEQGHGPGRDTLVVAQVDGLLCTDFYGPGGSSSSRLNSKSYQPTPLHATVVLNWPDRSAQDRQDVEEHDEVSDEPVVLLSPVVEPALVRFDRYDERSLIENRLNRDGKQYFGLGQSLARNEAAMWTATVQSTLAIMLYRALERHREQALEDFDRRGERLGVVRYRRQMMLRNRGRIVVTVDGYYGLLTFREFAAMAGFDMG